MAEEEAAAKAPRHGKDLTQGPIGKTLLAFALPTLISSILQSLNGSINSIWIGRFLGEKALASTFNANMIMFLLMAFVFGFGMASTVLIGQAFGAKNVDQARRVFGTAVGGFMPLAILIGIVGYFASPAILRILAFDPTAAPLALAYLRVIFLAMPGILVLVMMMMALRGAGDAMTPLWFMFLAVILDAGLNPVFILGLGPAPKLGIAGSALATTIANYVGLTALIVTIYVRDLPLRLRGAELRYLIPDGQLLKLIVRKGFPMGLQMIVISSSALATIGLVNREGVDTTAAFGVAMQLWTYLRCRRWRCPPPQAQWPPRTSAPTSGTGSAGLHARASSRISSSRECWCCCLPLPIDRRWHCFSATTARRCPLPSISRYSPPGASFSLA